MSDVGARLSSILGERYRIEREIGSGGMATVYLAHDLKHDRDVALKVLRQDLAAVLGAQRFLNEIRITARLDHPHILTLIDSGAADGVLYYVMPLVRGESLRARLERERQLPVDEALDITRQITSALDYAHRQGVVHRDIKPENILLHEGEAVLADFGIAMAVREAGGDRLTETGVSLGTPQYMSPEQAAGDRLIDARSDVYSMGAVLYEMLAGEPPFTGASMQSLVARLLTEPPTRLRVLRATVPRAVDEAVATALAKAPADRPATAGDFARALTAQSVTKRWAPSITPARAIAALGAIAAIALAALFVSRRSAPPPLPDRVQLTLTGNAITPSLSPDGTRLAFAEKQCGESGACTYQLVVQDVEGTGRLVVTRDIGYIYKTQWTADGRFVAFAGSHPPLRHGAFAVSTLGGETRYLGCCVFDLIAGDTSFLLPGTPAGANRWWVRRVTVHDGQIVDSIPLGDTSPQYVAGLTIPDRLLLLRGQTPDVEAELHLADFEGRIVDRLRPATGYRPRWVPARERLVIAAQRDAAGTSFDVLTMRVSASAIGPKIDTVMSGLELGNGIFDVSQDGERLVYYGGPVETSVATLDIDRTSPWRPATKPILSATTRMSGRISPAGDRVLLARDTPRGGEQASQFSLMPRTGGAERQIPGAVADLLDFEWSPDGTRFIGLQRIDAGQLRLIERDTIGSETRELARLPVAAAVKIHPLSDGSVALVPAQRRAVSVFRRPGKRNVTWDLPAWMSVVARLSPTSDARSLAVGGLNRSSDSVVVALLDIETGRFTRIGSIVGSDLHGLAGLADGTVLSILREPGGAWAFDQSGAGRAVERIGTIPHTQAEFSISSDGAHVVVFDYRDRNDVYMIRNFGRLLR